MDGGMDGGKNGREEEGQEKRPGGRKEGCIKKHKKRGLPVILISQPSLMKIKQSHLRVLLLFSFRILLQF